MERKHWTEKYMKRDEERRIIKLRPLACGRKYEFDVEKIRFPQANDTKDGIVYAKNIAVRIVKEWDRDNPGRKIEWVNEVTERLVELIRRIIYIESNCRYCEFE